MSSNPSDPKDCRCPCGRLLARLTLGGVELKCRRCKRTVVIPLREFGVRKRELRLAEVEKKESV